MAAIIHKLPVEDARGVVHVRNHPVMVLPFQAVVWVSVVQVRPESLDPRTARFPAIIDLGYNGTFAIREEHLRTWAGMDARLFRKLRQTKLRGAPADQRIASLWLHPNTPNTRDIAGRPAFPLDLHQGMVVMRNPESGQPDLRPRLPLIGFRTFHDGDLKLSIRCKPGRLSIQTKRRFWL